MLVPARFCVFFLIILASSVLSHYENDYNFRIEPGSRYCYFEKAKAGQMMEVQYQVIDGQHGDLDISFDILDPNAVKILSDYKRAENKKIFDLELDGEYVFCMDNTFSMMNSKLVFVYILIEDKITDEIDDEAVVTAIDENGEEGTTEEGILEYMLTLPNGENYYIEIFVLADAMTRILKHVVKARHMLDIYGASKSRDSYLAVEDTFIVDMWSSLQIGVMFIVGLLQVYMIKKLFDKPALSHRSYF